jgi:hypothetical protein
MPVEKTIASSRAEIEQGRTWRAKEIIRSSLGNYGYNLDLYQFYGEVLLSMGDLQQAGKYLFFSKSELNDDEEKAVRVFLERHGTNGFKGVVANTPVARYQKLSEYPDFVQQRLRELGAKEDLFRFWEKVPGNGINTAVCGCLIVLVVLSALCIIGAVTVIRWLF